MAEQRPTKQEVVKQLADALTLEHVKPETREIVLSLFADKYVEFVQIRLKPCSAIVVGARERGNPLEPSDLLLELLAAVVANDVDKILAMNHEFRSLVKSDA
jgi:hypothetical protein